MKWIETYERRLVATLFLPLLGLWGCSEYTVETTLNADGSGIRHETMVVQEDDRASFEIAPEVFAKLMHVTDEDRWSYSKEPDNDGDEVHVFRRETRVEDLAAWGELSRRIHISAALDDGAGLVAGDPRYADVGFWNSIQVESGRGPGGRTYTFRERFFWQNLLDVLIDRHVAGFRREVEVRYPDLAPERRGELIGLVKGAVWTAVDEGLWDMDDGERERAFAPLIERLTEQTVRIVRARYPNADERFFADSFRSLLVEGDEDGDEDFDDFIWDKLPGAELAANLQFEIRLTMPGRVVASNADERDGSTLLWEFSPWDAVPRPIEIFAESMVEREVTGQR